MKLTKNVQVLNEEMSNRGSRIFDETSGILFWDDISNQAYYELIKIMREAFWIPEEVSMAGDKSHWNTVMTDKDKELYKDGIGVLASLDSIATYFDTVAAHYIKDPAVKANMAFIAGMESIHNESYTYAPSSIMSKSEILDIFERPKTNSFIVKRNRIMMDHFDAFMKDPTIENFAKALVAMAGLEGLCFVNGFTPFYHFNRDNKMFGTGKIIQYIQRDEVQHSYFQTLLVRDILTQYPEHNTEEFAEFAYDFFKELVQHEKDFCEDLYKDHPEIDLFEVLEYIEFRANLILDNLGLDKIFAVKKNPMLWIKAFEPENANNTKTDFFEDKESNYTKPTEASNGWDEL